MCCFLSGCNYQKDYAEYINKIWVVDDWEGGEAYEKSSFLITEITDGHLNGKFATGAIAQPDSRDLFYNNSDYVSDLVGEVKEGTAESHFSDESGNSGTIKLIFKNGNEIEAEIVYKTEGVSYYNTKTEKGERNGNYTFKVYNLKTYSRHFVATEEQMKTVELNGWGQVQLVAEVYDTGDHKYPELYLTNLEGDILYYFDSYYTESSIKEIIAEDINGDGLKDVKVILDLGEDHKIEYVYLQTEDGHFLGDQDY